MGRGRGKGKKQTARDNSVSGDDEGRIPAYKRRGRPQKTLKGEVEDDEQIEPIESDDEFAKISITDKDSDNQISADNVTKRRKRSSQVIDNSDSIEDENGSECNNAKAENSIKLVGFRQNGSRRKSKPRRAAEAGVECD